MTKCPQEVTKGEKIFLGGLQFEGDTVQGSVKVMVLGAFPGSRSLQPRFYNCCNLGVVDAKRRQEVGQKYENLKICPQ